MTAIRLNALQAFLARPDAEEVQAHIAALSAAGLTRKDIAARTGYSNKFLYQLSVHQGLRDGSLQPNTACSACAKPLYVVPSKLSHDNFCNKTCVAAHLRLPAPIERACNHCGAPFQVRSHGVRTASCSYACSVQFRTTSMFRQCLTCDKEMGPLHPSSKRKYCGRKCSGKSMERRVTKTCMQCGATDDIPVCHDRNKIYTCSDACLLLYRNTNVDYKMARAANISAAIRKKWSTDAVWAKAQRLAVSKRSSDAIKAWGHTRPSSAEAACADILKACGIVYESQHQIYSEKYGAVKCYDFYLPLQDVLVEVHGTFWHADPRAYPDRYNLAHTQKHNLANDAIKKDIVESESNKVLIIVWEHDLTHAPLDVAKFFTVLKQKKAPCEPK